MSASQLRIDTVGQLAEALRALIVNNEIDGNVSIITSQGFNSGSVHSAFSIRVNAESSSIVAQGRKSFPNPIEVRGPTPQDVYDKFAFLFDRDMQSTAPTAAEVAGMV